MLVRCRKLFLKCFKKLQTDFYRKLLISDLTISKTSEHKCLCKGLATRIEYTTDSKFIFHHRTKGPAFIIKCKKCGSFTHRWETNDRLHRDPNIDGNVSPAYIDYDCSPYWSKTIELMWYKNGVLHRVNGPALYKNYLRGSSVKGTLYKIKWYNNGKIHNNDFSTCGKVYPAIIKKSYNAFTKEWYSHGDKLRSVIKYKEVYTDKRFKNGKLHNEDGPAFIRIKGNNKIVKWYYNGKKHRSDGPAVEKMMTTGVNYCQEWWADGERIK